MTSSGNPASPLITVSFSGSSIAGVSGAAIINYGWEFNPTSFNPFPAAITGTDLGMFYFKNGSATYRNATRGQITTINGVWLQDSSNSSGPFSGIYERFGILEEFTERNQNSYAIGDLVEWSGSAMIDLSWKGLTFDDLQVGTTGPIVGYLGILEGQIIIVPEPSTSLFLISFATVIGLRCKRRWTPYCPPSSTARGLTCPSSVRAKSL